MQLYWWSYEGGVILKYLLNEWRQRNIRICSTSVDKIKKNKLQVVAYKFIVKNYLQGILVILVSASKHDIPVLWEMLKTTFAVANDENSESILCDVFDNVKFFSPLLQKVKVLLIGQ